MLFSSHLGRGWLQVRTWFDGKMKKVALIFPGQGAQRVGMGRDFYENSSDARAVFDKAESVVGAGFLKIIFEGPEEKLTSTAFCQPAILTTSIAALKAFQSHPKYKNIQIAFTAGLSLGEYSALVAAGVFSFEDALRLVQKRATLMEEATRLAQGKMAAIIGFDQSKLMDICRQTGAEVANYNSSEQIVITGHATKVEEASRLIKEAGAKNVIPLDVSGAFHSSLMKPAAEKFQTALESVKINTTAIKVISNVDAQPHIDPQLVRANLAKQITSSVQWVNSVEYMARQGVNSFLEIGPGRVLKGLIRKIDSNLVVNNIQTFADIDSLVE